MNSGLSNIVWSSIVTHHYLTKTFGQPVQLALPEFNDISKIIQFKKGCGIVSATWLDNELSKHGPRRDILRSSLFKCQLVDNIPIEVGASSWVQVAFVQRWKFAGQVADQSTRLLPSEYFVCEKSNLAGTVLHVRRGDYATWRHGAYYYTIDEMLKILGNHNIDWVVTDCPQTRKRAQQIGFKVSDGTLKQDIQLLCSSSQVIGPPSTLNMLGAWISGAEVTWVMRNEGGLFSSVLGKVKSFYSFDAGCIFEPEKSELLEIRQTAPPSMKSFY